MPQNLITRADLLDDIDLLAWCLQSRTSEIVERFEANVIEDRYKKPCVYIDNGSNVLAIAPLGAINFTSLFMKDQQIKKKLRNINVAERIGIYTALKLANLGMNFDILFVNKAGIWLDKNYNWMVNLSGNGACVEVDQAGVFMEELQLFGYEVADPDPVVQTTPNVYSPNDALVMSQAMGTYRGSFCRVLELVTQMNRLKQFYTCHKDTEFVFKYGPTPIDIDVPPWAVEDPEEEGVLPYDPNGEYECSYCNQEISGEHIAIDGTCPWCYSESFEYMRQKHD